MQVIQAYSILTDMGVNRINPQLAECCWGNIKTHLHLHSFLTTQSACVVEILPRWCQGPTLIRIMAADVLRRQGAISNHGIKLVPLEYSLFERSKLILFWFVMRLWDIIGSDSGSTANGHKAVILKNDDLSSIRRKVMKYCGVSKRYFHWRKCISN